jgi:hypothetical protein
VEAVPKIDVRVVVAFVEAVVAVVVAAPVYVMAAT